MKYSDTLAGTFLDRPNRFIANVSANGENLTVHVKNTGRCRELLLPGVSVTLAKGVNPGRRTAYDLISVVKPGRGPVNIDSQAPNVVVKQWLSRGPREFPGITLLRPEHSFGQSRVDFYLEQGPVKSLIEVKGCTLERDGIGYFPDAPTLRGEKHLRELAKAVSEGYSCYIAFVIAVNGVRRVLPNRDTDPAFARALEEALKAGVKMLYLPCRVTPDSLEIIDTEAALSDRLPGQTLSETP